MFVKATATRFGLAALWVVKEAGDVELYRLEQIGRRIIARKVLWGDRSRWNPEAQKMAEFFIQEDSAGTADIKDLITMLISEPLKRGEVTRKVQITDPRLRGSVQGMLFDIDLLT